MSNIIAAPQVIPLTVPLGGSGLITVAAGKYLKGNDAAALVPRTIAEMLIDLGMGRQIFTASGNFVAPVGITKVYLTMVGGGGNGAPGVAGTYGGGGGSGGSWVIRYAYTVVPGNNYAVTINGPGGTSIFDTLIILAGSNAVATAGGICLGTLDGAPAPNGLAGGPGIKGGNGWLGETGANLMGAPGGGTPWGKGGAGGFQAVGFDGTGYGSGGGGGGGDQARAGGIGTGGFVLVEW